MQNFKEQTTIGAFATPSDPWEGQALDFEWRDNWLLGYIDILTLFITLLVVLLALGNHTTAPVDQELTESPAVQAKQIQLSQSSQSEVSQNQPLIEQLEVPEASSFSVLDVEISWGESEEAAQAQISRELVSKEEPSNTMISLDISQSEGLIQSRLEQRQLELAELIQNDRTQGELSSDLLALQEMTPKKSNLSVIEQAEFKPFTSAPKSLTSEADVLLETNLSSEKSSIADNYGLAKTDSFKTGPDTTVEGLHPDLQLLAKQSQQSSDPQISRAEITAEANLPNTAFEQMVEQLQQEGLDKRVKVKPLAQGALLELQDNILFPLGSAELKQEGLYLLEDLLEILIDKGGRVSIEGHSDNQPIFSNRYPSNWELSSGRATQVARYLISGGYDPAKLRVVGYADTQPVASNETPEGRAQNRRVSLVVELLDNAEMSPSKKLTLN